VPYIVILIRKHDCEFSSLKSLSEGICQNSAYKWGSLIWGGGGAGGEERNIVATNTLDNCFQDTLSTRIRFIKATLV
jgi:hypothetical protein